MVSALIMPRSATTQTRPMAKRRRSRSTTGIKLVTSVYRTMAWLGEELAAAEQDGRTPFAPRCTKDVVEEQLFAGMISAETIAALEARGLLYILGTRERTEKRGSRATNNRGSRLFGAKAKSAVD